MYQSQICRLAANTERVAKMNVAMFCLHFRQGKAMKKKRHIHFSFFFSHLALSIEISSKIEPSLELFVVYGVRKNKHIRHIFQIITIINNVYFRKLDILKNNKTICLWNLAWNAPFCILKIDEMIKSERTYVYEIHLSLFLNT